jgi:hypothetical protein
MPSPTGFAGTHNYLQHVYKPHGCEARELVTAVPQEAQQPCRRRRLQRPAIAAFSVEVRRRCCRRVRGLRGCLVPRWLCVQSLLSSSRLRVLQLRRRLRRRGPAHVRRQQRREAAQEVGQVAWADLRAARGESRRKVAGS